MFGLPDYYTIDHESFYRKVVWKQRFAFFPKRCIISGKRIWLKQGMEGVAIWYGPGDPAVEVRWHDTKEHIVWLLRGKR